MVNKPLGVDFQDIPIGAEIFTSDEERIGKVQDVRGGSFKVNAPMQPDYWLPTRMVSSTAVNRVMLSFTQDQLGDHKNQQPLVA
jgi:Uncharacterized protein conserved in bacteria (DUF2171)